MLRRIFLVPVMLLVLLAGGCRSGGAVGRGFTGIWVKGNTHCHSTLSDGNVSPEEAIGWYREHGYGFVVLTDHNAAAPQQVFDACTSDKFVAIRGEEVTMGSGADNFAVHINAIGLTKVLTPFNDPSRVKMVKENCRAISESGAIPQLNHPSFYLTDPDAVKAPQGPVLIEVYNHGTSGKAIGPLAQMAFEQAWDAALTAGVTAYAVASDDTHNYKVFKPGNSNPGGGWIMVNVPKLTRQEILKSLRAGRFYASNGVELDDIRFDGKSLTVTVKPSPGRQYTTSFIGKSGKLLGRQSGTTAIYRLTGSKDELYVRARVTADDGKMAWTQAVGAKRTGSRE